jgi:hypothetical protein
LGIITILGVKDGRRDYVKQGAISALRWGMQIQRSNRKHRTLYISINNNRPNRYLEQFFINNPLVCDDRGKFKGLLFLRSKDKDRRREIEALKRKYFIPMIRLLKPNDPNDNQLPLQILQAMGLYRMLQIDCRKVPEEILRSLEHFRTNVLVSYPGVLAQIACDSIRPAIYLRFIVVESEVLTPLMRHQITKTFGAPLYNTYGSHEFNLIAWECKDTHELHTCDDSVIVEVLKNGRPAVEGERGEVVGTNLHSFAMPFIRYRLGDIVTKGSETCGCGQPFSTIRDVQGRMIDYFSLPGGRVIHPYEIVVIILRDFAPWLRQYQLVQEREDRIVLKAATWATPSSQKVAQLEENVGKLLGTDVEFQMILVPEIQLEPSGKFRVSRSLVKSHYDEVDFLSVPL